MRRALVAQLIYPVLALSLLVASCAAPETPVKIIGPIEVLVEGDTGPQELPNMRFLPSHPNFDPYIRIDSNLAAFGGKSQSEIAVILGNPNLNMSCVFMTAKDTLTATEAKSLPAKTFDEEKKLGI